MKIHRGILLKLCLVVLVGTLAFGDASAQSGRASKDDKTKTRQAQAVSKEVYDRITKAQEMLEDDNDRGALQLLNRLYNPDKLTEYEQANVLNYIGFIHYNMDQFREAISTYEKLLRIPSLELQMAKQTTFTVAQLLTMEEKYSEALITLDKWFILETNPSAEPFMLKAQLFYHLDRYQEMVKPIENAM
ncbi:hypothetical protein IIC38_06180, partial [candidate division KSB1 bacterium]|nr:hypothetical protein [candidate division KSB1 bacterium]